MNPLLKILGIKTPLGKFEGKVWEKFFDSENSLVHSDKAEYGDVIGVDRDICQHYGIYIDDYHIIHYSSTSVDFEKDIYIHETTMLNFLGDADSYFVCKFPDFTDKLLRTLLEIKRPAIVPYSINNNFKKIKQLVGYKLYTPEETVSRARGRLTENKYNLVRDNCEHFAIWCKTGVSDSLLVNAVKDLMKQERFYI